MVTECLDIFGLILIFIYLFDHLFKILISILFSFLSLYFHLFLFLFLVVGATIAEVSFWEDVEVRTAKKKEL